MTKIEEKAEKYAVNIMTSGIKDEHELGVFYGAERGYIKGYEDCQSEKDKENEELKEALRKVISNMEMLEGVILNDYEKNNINVLHYRNLIKFDRLNLKQILKKYDL